MRATVRLHRFPLQLLDLDRRRFRLAEHVEADTLLLIGADPGLDNVRADVTSTAELDRLAAGRTEVRLAVPEVGVDRDLSGTQMAVYVRAGRLHVAQLGLNKLELQRHGSPVDADGVLRAPGDELDAAAATVWLPTADNAKPTVHWHVQIVNPFGERLRAEAMDAQARRRAAQLAANVVRTHERRIPPPLSTLRLASLAWRFSEFLRFPAVNRHPSLDTPDDADEDLLKRLRTEHIPRHGSSDEIPQGDGLLLERLLQDRLLFLDDFVPRPITGRPRPREREYDRLWPPEELHDTLEILEQIRPDTEHRRRSQ